MIHIDLFLLGYVWDFNLKAISGLLNGPSRVITASIQEPIRKIGEPNLFDMGYSDSSLFKLFPSKDDRTFQVGITAIPLEDNFFTRSEKPNSIAITIFQVDELCEKSGRTKEEYVVHTILCQLLWAQYKERRPSAGYDELFHLETRGCLFDVCRNKSDIVIGLRSCQIDSDCMDKLIKADVSEKIVREAKKILDRIRTPSFLQTFQLGMKNPLFSFILGGLVLGLFINVLSSLALGEFDSRNDYYIAAFLFILTILMILGNYLILIRRSSKLNNQVFSLFQKQQE